MNSKGKLGWSLIYRKLKSLIITYSNSNRSTCDYGEQRNSGDRGTVGTEEQWAQRNSGPVDLIGVKGSSSGQGSTVQLTPDNSNPR